MENFEFLFKGLKVKDDNSHLQNSHKKSFGKGSRSCRACFTHTGLIRTYNLNLCRRCFREYAEDIGFRQLD
ncbi:hypothetical protein EDEG_03541 [Edhazardia aedis USNM 41457]|uniref:40S ribosomal protein S29 n=1 Tax=Edhazardia aedis (strain USNM 41457) TaxID=1003232 RepID=J9D2F6_EDHAE|nr:hypothetical protein EDEG_03541 [Edhazardia aedis USNM 41457]|eukprot:EJW02016.1 hypothetical protein EDEG_03541 [Edhazardia aedis USNM 41457]